MTLQRARGERPEMRICGVARDGRGIVERYSQSGPYDGEWYRVPPYYIEREGFGIRNDRVLGALINVHLINHGLPTGLKITSE